MKKHIATILTFFLPFVVFAAYNDAILTTETVITAGGVNLTVSGAQASVDSITVNTDNFQVIMSGSASIQVTSSDRRTFSVTGAIGSVAQTFTCSASESVFGLSNPSTAPQVTLTVAPNSSACTVEGGGSGGGGGGGGIAPTIPAQSATPATPTVSPATPAIPATPSSSAQPSARALAVSPAFNKLLKLGSVNADVKRLQIILNSDPDTRVALKGAGSSGKETTKFGAATKKALIKFQLKYEIIEKSTDKGAGVLGPATRAKIQELFKKAETEKKELKKEVKKKTTIKKKELKKEAKKKTSLKKKTTIKKKELKKEAKKKTTLKKKTTAKKTVIKKKTVVKKKK